MGNRTKAREIALQGLYSLEINPKDKDDILDFSWVKEKGDLDQEISHYAKYLIIGVMENMPEIDQKIEGKLKRWDFNRVARVDLSLLRLGCFQILYQSDTAPSVVIDEMIKLSKKFSSPQSYRFINGILDSISKENSTL